jgi:hypothetical protein
MWQKLNSIDISGHKKYNIYILDLFANIMAFVTMLRFKSPDSRADCVTFGH